MAGRKLDQAWFDEVVETVGIDDRLKNLPSQLSGGQQQRVAVARALVPRPDIIFADEPTGALDSAAGDEMLTLMRRAVDEGQTMVMVTHDPHAASYADDKPVPPTGAVRSVHIVYRHPKAARAHR